MKTSELNELINNNEFKYDKNLPPADNYILFQQAICFENGVEFLSSSNESKTPIIYLLNVPRLSIDKEKANLVLKKFHENIMDQLDAIFEKEADLFKIYKTYFDLLNAVTRQHREYINGREKYFGSVTIKEFPERAIKQIKLPLVRANYRGVFLNAFALVQSPIAYNELGVEIKEYLSKLYMLKRMYNAKLITKLNGLKKILFYEKSRIRHYRYKGDISDLVEIGLAIALDEKVESLIGKQIDFNIFCKDFSNFLGLPYSKLSNYTDTLNKRYTQNKLFIKEGLNKLQKYLESQ